MESLRKKIRYCLEMENDIGSTALGSGGSDKKNGLNENLSQNFKEKTELDNVSKKILEDADTLKKQILDDAYKKREEILNSALVKKAEIIKKAQEDAKEIYKKVYELEMSNARFKANQEILLNKIKLIDGLIYDALEVLKTKYSERFLEFIKNLICSLELEEFEYQIGKQEKLITDDFILNIQNQSGKKFKIKKSSSDADFDDGIKIIQGKKEYHISAQTLIREKIEEIKIKLAEFLFKDSKI